MPELNSPHIATSGVNTFGTTFDLIPRPGLDEDTRCNDLLRRVIEGVMVVFPKEAEIALQDSLIAALQDVNGRFANLNLLRISLDANNAAETGSDGGILVSRAFASSMVTAAAGVAGVHSLPLTGFPSAAYQVSVEPAIDPGEFRWWVVSKAKNQLTVGYIATNAVTLNITAQG